MSLSLFNLTALSCQSLFGNPLRSGLSMVGVFMGVAAVSATLQVGKISKTVIAQQLSEQDAPHVRIITRRNPATGAPAQLTQADLQFLQQRLNRVRAVSGLNWIRRQNQVLFQETVVNPNVNAVAPDFLLATGRKLIKGRDFDAADYEEYRPVVVIDRHLEEELFQQDNGLGQVIYYNLRPYTVIGVLPTRLTDAEPQGELMISTAVYSSMTGRKRIRSLVIRPERLEDILPVEEKALQLLEQRFPGYSFWVRNSVQDILEQQQTLKSVSQALLVVGIIALLVGGVGIANITIAAVIERTPEIGLRRAIGATQADVMLQFILEAVILSLLGGMVAVVTVHFATIGIAKQFDLPYEFDRRTTGIALCAAVVVGVSAGFLPALRASQLDPVKALRGD
ncbi:MAG: ABC transporter permease [Microcoleaceae cyanobacterium]